MKNQCQHLIVTQRNELLKLLHKFVELFDGTLGTWKTDPLGLKLKYDSNTICSQPYPVPKVHKKISKREVESLGLLQFLEVVNDSEWGVPSSIKHKPEINRVNFLSDFSNINK